MNDELADITAEFGGEGPLVAAAAIQHVENMVRAGLCKRPPGPWGQLTPKALRLLARLRELGWRPDPQLFEERIAYVAVYGLTEIYQRRGKCSTRRG